MKIGMILVVLIYNKVHMLKLLWKHWKKSIFIRVNKLSSINKIENSTEEDTPGTKRFLEETPKSQDNQKENYVRTITIFTFCYL